MKTLDQFNEERRKTYKIDNFPVKNGIACPLCGKELYDTHPNMTLASNPPQKNVHCNCGYKGYRIA